MELLTNIQIISFLKSGLIKIIINIFSGIKFIFCRSSTIKLLEIRSLLHGLLHELRMHHFETSLLIHQHCVRMDVCTSGHTLVSQI